MESGLYAIIDADALERGGFDLLTVARGVLESRPRVLQLRAKSWSDRRTVDALTQLRALVPKETWLFANDRADLARITGCDGVHVGQTDLPPDALRAHFPELRFGLSTHDAEQFERALTLGLDYVALGPIFTTTSKENPDPVVGVAELGRLAQKARIHGVPVVAIGGISLDNVASLAGHATLVAAIGALLPAADASDVAAEVSRRARALTRAFRGDRDADA